MFFEENDFHEEDGMNLRESIVLNLLYARDKFESCMAPAGQNGYEALQNVLNIVDSGLQALYRQVSSSSCVKRKTTSLPGRYFIAETDHELDAQGLLDCYTFTL